MLIFQGVGSTLIFQILTNFYIIPLVWETFDPNHLCHCGEMPISDVYTFLQNNGSSKTGETSQVNQSWWVFPPIWKICSRKWESYHQLRGQQNIKNKLFEAQSPCKIKNHFELSSIFAFGKNCRGTSNLHRYDLPRKASICGIQAFGRWWFLNHPDPSVPRKRLAIHKSYLIVHYGPEEMPRFSACVTKTINVLFQKDAINRFPCKSILEFWCWNMLVLEA